MLKIVIESFEFLSDSCSRLEVFHFTDGSKTLFCVFELNALTLSFFNTADMMKIYHIQISSEYGVVDDGSFVCTEISCASDKGMSVCFVPYGVCRQTKRVFHD